MFRYIQKLKDETSRLDLRCYFYSLLASEQEFESV